MLMRRRKHRSLETDEELHHRSPGAALAGPIPWGSILPVARMAHRALVIGVPFGRVKDFSCALDFRSAGGQPDSL